MKKPQTLRQQLLILGTALSLIPLAIVAALMNEAGTRLENYARVGTQKAAQDALSHTTTGLRDLLIIAGSEKNEKIQAAFEAARLGKTGFALACNTEGIVLYSTFAEEVGKNFSQNPSRAEAAFVTELLHRSNVLTDNKVVLDTLPLASIGGKPALSFATGYAYVPAQKLTVIVAVPEGELYADALEASSLATNAGILEAIIVAVTVGITLFAWLRFSSYIARRVITSVERIGQGAHEITQASEDLSLASTALSDSASSQAAALEETSASLEEMSSMTRQNADHIQNARIEAFEAKKSAESGASAMQTMSNGMHQIQSSGQGLGRAMQEIESSSGAISKIIKTIDEIAFQTNILALNAAVEAARAGEAGLGFAVVADEVRSLALRSAEAARETATLIETSIDKSRQGADISREVSGNLTSMLRNADLVDVHLQQIVEKARRVDELMNQIVSASDEQKTGMQQINIAVGQMDTTTQSNAGKAEDTAAAAKKLASQSLQILASTQELLQLVKI